jgi:hypothetical protein
MNGTILFNDITELAKFLKIFNGSTATFEVHKRGNDWLLTFLGGF